MGNYTEEIKKSKIKLVTKEINNKVEIIKYYAKKNCFFNERDQGIVKVYFFS